MAGAYTVKILSSEEFDKLPFKRAKEALGAADAKTGVAYVRDTGYNDITKETISHELDELMQAVSPHEEDGIRYKITGDIFKGIGGAVKSGVGALGRGVSSIGRGIKNIFTPGPAAPTATGPGGRTITGTPQGPYPAAGSGPTATGPGGRTIIGAPQMPTPPAVGGSFGGNNIFKSFGRGLSNAIGGIGDMFKGGGTSQPYDYVPDATSGGDKGGGGGFMDNLFTRAAEVAPGAIVAGLGQMFAPKTGDIDISGITGDLRNRITGTNPSDLYATGAGKLIEQMQDKNLAPPEEAFTRGDQVIEEDLADNIKSLEQQFKAATGSADVYNNSAFLREKSRLEERAREHRAAIRDEISFQFTREQLQRDLQEIEMALNLDKAQTAQLISLAQLDAEALAINYGLEMQEAKDFKALFSNFGQLMAGGGTQQGGTA